MHSCPCPIVSQQNKGRLPHTPPTRWGNSVLACYSVAGIEHWPTATWGWKRLFLLALNSSPLKDYREGTQGRNWRRGHGWSLLLACSPWLAHCFLLKPRITCPGGDPQWDGTWQISHQPRMTTNMPTAQSIGDNSSGKLPLSLESCFITLTKINQLNSLKNIKPF